MICHCPHKAPQLQLDLEKMYLNDHEWSLLSLQSMYEAGNSLEEITEVVPFRRPTCTRSLKCCGVCTRQCYSRCIQDCLHRVYMWRKMVESASEEQLRNIPQSIKYVVNQKFETLEDLSWVVGEIISRNSNSKLKSYMSSAQLRPEENPYKLDYAPTPSINPMTGKREVDHTTGSIKILQWPESGLCPYCLPRVTVDRRYMPREH